MIEACILNNVLVKMFGNQINTDKVIRRKRNLDPNMIYNDNQVSFDDFISDIGQMVADNIPEVSSDFATVENTFEDYDIQKNSINDYNYYEDYGDYQYPNNEHSNINFNQPMGSVVENHSSSKKYNFEETNIQKEDNNEIFSPVVSIMATEKNPKDDEFEIMLDDNKTYFNDDKATKYYSTDYNRKPTKYNLDIHKPRLTIKNVTNLPTNAKVYKPNSTVYLNKHTALTKFKEDNFGYQSNHLEAYTSNPVNEDKNSFNNIFSSDKTPDPINRDITTVNNDSAREQQNINENKEPNKMKNKLKSNIKDLNVSNETTDQSNISSLIETNDTNLNNAVRSRNVENNKINSTPIVLERDTETLTKSDIKESENGTNDITSVNDTKIIEKNKDKVINLSDVLKIQNSEASNSASQNTSEATPSNTNINNLNHVDFMVNDNNQDVRALRYISMIPQTQKKLTHKEINVATDNELITDPIEAHILDHNIFLQYNSNTSSVNQTSNADTTNVDKPDLNTTITNQTESVYLRNNDQDTIMVKSKSFPTGALELQTSTQAMYTPPCIYPYGYPYTSMYNNPYRVASENAQIFKIVPEINTPKTTQLILNPPMYPYMQIPPMSPAYFSNYVQQTNNQNAPLQVNGPGGQYYMCNPISAPTNNVAAMPGIEVRRQMGKLQDVVQNIPTFKER